MFLELHKIHIFHRQHKKTLVCEKCEKCEGPKKNFFLMKSEYRYKLASDKFPKPNCPYCGAKKHWQRYYDIRTGEPLPEEFGRCDNEDKCGQHDNPYKMGYAKMIREKERGNKIYLKHRTTKHRANMGNYNQSKPDPVFMPKEVLNQTLKGYDKNIFIQNLCSRVPFPF